MTRTTEGKRMSEADGAAPRQLPAWTEKLKEVLARMPLAEPAAPPAEPANDPDGTDDARSRPFPGAA